MEEVPECCSAVALVVACIVNIAMWRPAAIELE